jgi:hypothetical protein
VAGSRLTEGKRPLAAICVFVVCLGLWNAARYPTGAGFDASSHMAYADGLFPGWHLPHPSATEATEYYTPPGFYFVAGVADWLLAQTGYGDPDRAAQAVNVAYLLGTVLLVAAVARELWPGRRRIELGAASFVAFLPVVVETGAMPSRADVAPALAEPPAAPPHVLATPLRRDAGARPVLHAPGAGLGARHGRGGGARPARRTPLA